MPKELQQRLQDLGPGIQEQLTVSFGASFSGDTTILDYTSLGKITKEIPGKPSFGFNGQSSRAQTTVERLDINGDGLPDIVWRVYDDDNVYVRLNLGRRLGRPEVYGRLPEPVRPEDDLVDEPHRARGRLEQGDARLRGDAVGRNGGGGHSILPGKPCRWFTGPRPRPTA